jgi:N-acetylneuraminic acid mutarotase
MIDILFNDCDICYQVIEFLDIKSIYNLKLIIRDFKINNIILKILTKYYIPNINIDINEIQLINWITYKIELNTFTFENFRARYLHRCVKVSNDIVYIYGGAYCKNNNHIGNFNDLYEWRIKTNNFKKIEYTNNMRPVASCATTLSSYQNNLYLFGGLYSGGFSNDMFIFNINSNTWLKFENQTPPPRWGHIMCNYKNYLILHGGSNMETVLNDLWIFDITNNIWIEKNINGLIGGRSGHSAIIYNDKLYIFGGNTHGYSLNDLWTIDLSDLNNLVIQQINQINPPKPRIGASFVSISNRLYLYSGRDKMNDIYYNDLCIYNTDIQSWHIIDNIIPNIKCLTGYCAFTTDTEIIINGGYDGAIVYNTNYVIKVL